MIDLQYDLFQSEKDAENSRSYLEILASTCGHIANFGSLEYGCIRNFLKGDLQIRVIDDGNNSKGTVNWQREEVFSYRIGEEEIWKGEEVSPSEDMSESSCENDWEIRDRFDVEKYVPGPWERIVMKLYEELWRESLTSD